MNINHINPIYADFKKAKVNERKVIKPKNHILKKYKYVFTFVLLCNFAKITRI